MVPWALKESEQNACSETFTASLALAEPERGKQLTAPGHVRLLVLSAHLYRVLSYGVRKMLTDKLCWALQNKAINLRGGGTGVYHTTWNNVNRHTTCNTGSWDV